jgi:hypothetical protein
MKDENKGKAKQSFIAEARREQRPGDVQQRTCEHSK